MICTCFGKTFNTRVVTDAARVLLGVPAYETYVAHMAAEHSDLLLMSQEEFFDERQKARFGGVGLRCC